MHPEACQAEKLKSEQRQLVGSIEVNQLNVTLQVGNGESIWYIGCCTSIDNDSIVKFVIDHMNCVQMGSQNYQ